MTKCRSCRGTYQAIGADGVPYAHVCGPVVVVAVIRDGTAQAVPLAELRASDTVRVRRDGKPAETTVALLQPADVRLGDTARARPNPRNENPDPRKVERADPDALRESLIVAPGLGVDDVPDVAPAADRGGV